MNFNFQNQPNQEFQVFYDPEEANAIVELNPTKGKPGKYPWHDPQMQVGSCFFVPVPPEKFAKDLGRPALPTSGSRKWNTRKAKNPYTQQVGYKCKRIK